MIKSLLILIAVSFVSVCTGGCGKAQKNTPVSEASYTNHVPSSLMGDQDSDNPGGSYDDGDDESIRHYGHAADASDAQAITTLVEHYYAAAASGSGARACALTYFVDVETIPEHYGQPPGPLWLRGAHTCPVVLSRVFQHFHAQLTAPIKVTAVRVDDDRADALVGFRTLPAGVVMARREGGKWKIKGLLAVALP